MWPLSYIQVSFRVEYTMSLDKYKRDVLIAVGILIALAVVSTVIQTWSWTRRAGRLAIDFVTLLKFLVFACGNVANAIFVVVLGSSIWWLVFFKVRPSQSLILLTVKCMVLLDLSLTVWVQPEADLARFRNSNPPGAGSGFGENLFGITEQYTWWN